jgi:hypothetical protein
MHRSNLAACWCRWRGSRRARVSREYFQIDDPFIVQFLTNNAASLFPERGIRLRVAACFRAVASAPREVGQGRIDRHANARLN